MPNFTQIYTIQNAGGTDTVALDTIINHVVLEGGAITLAANYTLAYSGTPSDSKEVTVQYRPTSMDLNGNSITILGTVLTASQASKNLNITALYNSNTTSFDVFIEEESGDVLSGYEGVTSTALTAGGGTVNLTPGTSKTVQLFTGNVTLTGSWTIQGAGTPVEGDEFTVAYEGTITADGNNITIFGESLSDAEILAGGVYIQVRYDGASWKVVSSNLAETTCCGILNKTQAQMITDQASNSFIPGKMYFITDKDIYIRAAGVDFLENVGTYKLLVPDYQNVNGNFIGVWTSALAPNLNELVAWDGAHYKNLTGANGGSNPASDAVNWDYQDPSNSSENADYITEYLYCEYDLNANSNSGWIERVKDARGNDIGGSYEYEVLAANGYNVITKFQFGNDDVHSNYCFESLFDCINNITAGQVKGNSVTDNSTISANTNSSLMYYNKVSGNSTLTATSSTGTISSNIVSQGSTLTATTNTGIITGNTISELSTLTATTHSGSTLRWNITGDTTVTNNGSGTLTGFNLCFPAASITAPTSGTVNGRTLTDGFSSFTASISITGLTTLDVTAANNLVGEITLTSGNATETITDFSNFPSTHPVKFYPASGLTVTFTHATGADQPTCAGAINAVINGTNGDWIEFTNVSGSRIYQTAGETY